MVAAGFISCYLNGPLQYRDVNPVPTSPLDDDLTTMPTGGGGGGGGRGEGGGGGGDNLLHIQHFVTVSLSDRQTDNIHAWWG